MHVFTKEWFQSLLREAGLYRGSIGQINLGDLLFFHGCLMLFIVFLGFILFQKWLIIDS